jgi:hypothetical protein
VEDRFEGTTIVDLRKDGRIVVPAGSVVRGMVTSVNKAGRIERKGSLTVVFDRITIDGRSYPIRATVTQAIESEGVKGEVRKISAGAGRRRDHRRHSRRRQGAPPAFSSAAGHNRRDRRKDVELAPARCCACGWTPG